MEPTLSLAKAELESEIGLFLGYGRGKDAGDKTWTSAQTAIIESLRKSGERQFYYCPALPEMGIEAGYEWSWLKPVATLTLASGEKLVALPDDFGGLEGQLSVSTSTATGWSPLDFVGIGAILSQEDRYGSTTIGQPLMACQEPLANQSGRKGQRFRLHVWPTADADYTLRLRYYLNPDALTDAFPYLYGGAEHGETIKASCIAAAELYLDDTIGPRAMYWKERLLASINMDRRKKPQLIGYNGDNSDSRWRGRWRRWDQRDPIVTFNGTQYD